MQNLRYNSKGIAAFAAHGEIHGISGILIMNDKKRAKIMKVCKVVALILAVLMVLGVIMQGFIR